LEGYVFIERTTPRPNVVQLTLNRPERLNALTWSLVKQLHEQLDALAEDRQCRAVILTGAGRGFCAGLDLDGFGAVDGTADMGRIQRHWEIQRSLAALTQQMRRLPQPVIAAVNGPAAGGGLALVCASDVRIASSAAVFATAFIRVGVTGCDMGTSWLLPRLVGAGRAHELMMTGRRFVADEALAMGLLADVVAPEELGARVDAMVDSLVMAPPMSLALTKQGMWAALEIPSYDAMVELENRQQILTMLTEDAAEAKASHRVGRPPQYRQH